MPDHWDFTAQRRTEKTLPIITYGLCGLCILFSIAHFYRTANPTFARIDAIVAPGQDEIWNGAYYGLITTFFAHVNWIHLLFNMMWLVQLGRAMEAALPPWGYFLFLMSAAAVSMGCELAVMGHGGIGASGVVYAMFGLMWVGRARYREWEALANRQNLNVFLIWGVFCIFSTFAGFMAVANVAHFSGLLYGLALGWLFLAPRRQPLWSIPLGLIVVLSALSLFWLPWSAEWYNYRAGKAFKAKDYRAAIDGYHRSLRLGGERYNNWENISRAWGNIAIEALKRNDMAAAQAASAQSDSAKRLEGTESTEASQPAGMPNFGRTPPDR